MKISFRKAIQFENNLLQCAFKRPRLQRGCFEFCVGYARTKYLLNPVFQSASRIVPKKAKLGKYNPEAEIGEVRRDFFLQHNLLSFIE